MLVKLFSFFNKRNARTCFNIKNKKIHVHTHLCKLLHLSKLIYETDIEYNKNLLR